MKVLYETVVLRCWRSWEVIMTLWRWRCRTVSISLNVTLRNQRKQHSSHSWSVNAICQ